MVWWGCLEKEGFLRWGPISGKWEEGWGLRRDLQLCVICRADGVVPYRTWCVKLMEWINEYNDPWAPNGSAAYVEMTCRKISRKYLKLFCASSCHFLVTLTLLVHIACYSGWQLERRPFTRKNAPMKIVLNLVFKINKSWYNNYKYLQYISHYIQQETRARHY